MNLKLEAGLGLLFLMNVLILGILAYFLFIHFKKTSDELKQANLKLQEIDKLKDDFVSIVSHELRTPMTAIRSYTWIALHRPGMDLNDNLKRYLVRILISSERLINLVNDMLNISKIESGKVEINLEGVDLVVLSRDIINEAYYSKLPDKKVEFALLEQDLPKISADPERLREVFLNIVNNALKYSPDGAKITISFIKDNENIITSVQDEGVGISNDDMKRLFTKFTRLDNSYTAMATSGGTGLGLYISRMLVEMMGGKIWASSEGTGKGTTFFISLPIAKSQLESHVQSVV